MILGVIHTICHVTCRNTVPKLQTVLQVLPSTTDSVENNILMAVTWHIVVNRSMRNNPLYDTQK